MTTHSPKVALTLGERLPEPAPASEPRMRAVPALWDGCAAPDEDPLVVADAVLDGVDQAVGHRPARLLVEGDRREVLDPCVQLEVRVAAGGDHGLALLKEVSAEPHVLVVRRDEQVDEMVAADRDMPDRHTIDDRYPRLELGLGLEPISELLPGAPGSGASSSSASSCAEYVVVKQRWW
jgi:hypothetical protein